MRVRFVCGFFISMLVCALIAWIWGYDFDTRSGWVAYGFACSILLSLGVGFALEDGVLKK